MVITVALDSIKKLTLLEMGCCAHPNFTPSPHFRRSCRRTHRSRYRPWLAVAAAVIPGCCCCRHPWLLLLPHWWCQRHIVTRGLAGAGVVAAYGPAGVVARGSWSVASLDVKAGWDG
jgi:hypothetical protein